ncbi:MAG: hypothetical protein OEV21_04815 [Thermoplasmata archaeon]|nr:hypothetical protein [Thermoplasmata archaeon]
MRTLIRLMLKEELRTHTTYSGQRFFTFPIVVFIFALILALFMERLLVEASLSQLMLLALASAFIYGIGVGSFGFMGRQYIEKRYGTQNYIVAMPSLLPITYRKTFLGLYIRDSIFYILLVLVPAVAGLLVASPFTGFKITSILFFFVAAVLSFQIGTSISFFGSILYNRSSLAFITFTSVLIALVILGGALKVFDIQLIVPALGFEFSLPPFAADYQSALLFLTVSLAMIFALIGLSIALMKFNFIVRDSRHESILPKYIEMFSLSKSYKNLVGKEFVDLRRSGTIGKMSFSFILPLVFLSFTSWFVNTGLGIEVGFNTVFYGAMVGFLGVLLYSWLNNVDSADYYSLIPVTVPQVIRARLIVFLFLTLGISTAFVVIISIMNNEVDILWLALLVMFITSIYMVVMTAYLTGLRTNTFLFDMGIMGRFAIMSFLPDVCLTILSFSLRTDPLFSASSIILVLAILIGTTIILLKGIETKWRRTGFDI